MSFQSLVPTSLISSTGFSSCALSDLTGRDANWCVANNNNTDTEAYVSFNTPTNTPLTTTDSQLIAVQARKTSGSSTSNHPNVRIEVWENGSLYRTSSELSCTSFTSQLFFLRWTTNTLADQSGANVEVKVFGTKTGGGPSTRSAVDFGEIIWKSAYSTTAQEVVKTVKSSGGDYTTINAWITGEDRFVAYSERAVMELDTSGMTNSRLDQSVDVAGTWSTPFSAFTSDGFIIFRPASGQEIDGTSGSGAWLYQNSAVNTTLATGRYQQTAQIQITQAGNGPLCVLEWNSNIERCLIDRTSGTADSLSSVSSAPNIDIVDCVVLASALGNIAIDATAMTSGNLLQTSTFGYISRGASSGQVIKNTVAWTSNSNPFGTNNAGTGSTNNTSKNNSTDSYPSNFSNTYTSGDLVDGTDFTDVANGDFSLPSGSAIEDQGTNLSGTVNTDIAGTSFSVPYPIGAFAAAAGTAFNVALTLDGLAKVDESNFKGRFSTLTLVGISGTDESVLRSITGTLTLNSLAKVDESLFVGMQVSLTLADLLKTDQSIFVDSFQNLSLTGIQSLNESVFRSFEEALDLNSLLKVQQTSTIDLGGMLTLTLNNKVEEVGQVDYQGNLILSSNNKVDQSVQVDFFSSLILSNLAKVDESVLKDIFGLLTLNSIGSIDQTNILDLGGTLTLGLLGKVDESTFIGHQATLSLLTLAKTDESIQVDFDSSLGLAVIGSLFESAFKGQFSSLALSGLATTDEVGNISANTFNVLNIVTSLAKTQQSVSADYQNNLNLFSITGVSEEVQTDFFSSILLNSLAKLDESIQVDFDSQLSLNTLGKVFEDVFKGQFGTLSLNSLAKVDESATITANVVNALSLVTTLAKTQQSISLDSQQSLLLGNIASQIESVSLDTNPSLNLSVKPSVIQSLENIIETSLLLKNKAFATESKFLGTFETLSLALSSLVNESVQTDFNGDLTLITIDSTDEQVQTDFVDSLNLQALPKILQGSEGSIYFTDLTLDQISELDSISTVNIQVDSFLNLRIKGEILNGVFIVSPGDIKQSPRLIYIMRKK